MDINLIAVGTRMPAWVNDGYREYARRLPRECTLSLTEIPLAQRGKSTPVQRAVDSEGRRMLDAIAGDRRVIALVGGRLKDVGIDELVAAVHRRARAAICFGAAGEALRQAISEARASHSDIHVERVDTLHAATRAVINMAGKGDTVLLSPGFDSFDEFDNYEHRGQAFTSLVKEIFAHRA